MSDEERARAQFEEAAQRALDQLKGDLRGLDVAQKVAVELTVSERSGRREVEVTLGPSGQLRDIKFPTKAYKRMGPQELSKTIIDTVRAAENRLLDKMNDSFKHLLPDGVTMHQIASGEVDMLQMMTESQAKLMEMFEESPEFSAAFGSLDLGGSARGRLGNRRSANGSGER